MQFSEICSRNWSSFFRLPTGVLNNRIAQVEMRYIGEGDQRTAVRDQEPFTHS